MSSHKEVWKTVVTGPFHVSDEQVLGSIWPKFALKPRIYSPLEIVNANFDFHSVGELVDEEKSGLESAIGLLCTFIALTDGFHAPLNYRLLADGVWNFLFRNGWKLGDEADCERFTEVRMSRGIASESKPESWEYRHYDRDEVNARRVLERWSTRLSGPLTDDEKGISFLLTHAALKGTMLQFQYLNMVHSTMSIVGIFDDDFEKHVSHFIRSEFLWRHSKLRYSALYAPERINERNGFVKIDGRIPFRDGSAVSLDCFEAGSNFVKLCSEFDIPLCSTQIALKYETRYL